MDLPVVLIDGRAAGVWSHERNGGTIEVTVEMLGRPTAAQKKAIAGEADRLGAFLEGPVRVSM
ncbi:MAG TPA: crosslink repair DNA glycosylase YcaQ family protein [Actinomycetota bacterium]|jgi:hypothetical protein|nr:crosslink repair DNA glycosylase YcaQ family protein [Actinomycetota bacterium]